MSYTYTRKNREKTQLNVGCTTQKNSSRWKAMSLRTDLDRFLFSSPPCELAKRDRMSWVDFPKPDKTTTTTIVSYCDNEKGGESSKRQDASKREKKEKKKKRWRST
jgi:hypothetical protein